MKTLQAIHKRVEWSEWQDDLRDDYIMRCELKAWQEITLSRQALRAEGRQALIEEAKREALMLLHNTLYGEIRKEVFEIRVALGRLTAALEGLLMVYGTAELGQLKVIEDKLKTLIDLELTMLSKLIVLLLLAMAVNAEEVQMVWDAPTIPEVTGHTLYRKALGDTAWVSLVAVDMPDTAVTTTLPASGTWEYHLTAFDAWGRESGPSNVVAVTSIIPDPEGLKIRRILIELETQ